MATGASGNARGFLAERLFATNPGQVASGCHAEQSVLWRCCSSKGWLAALASRTTVPFGLVKIVFRASTRARLLPYSSPLHCQLDHE